MEITSSIDVEDKVRLILSEHQRAYCAPLPANFAVPSILVTAAGGDSQKTNTGKGKVDAFTVVLDARANTEPEAFEYLRNAVAILEKGGDGIAHTEVNSLYSWGTDPARPDLAMCSATLIVTAHRETVTI